MPALDNRKQERFCREFVVDHNGKQAAIRAGYSPRSAEQQGSTLRSYPKVKARIAELEAEVAKELTLDAVEIAKRWSQLASADPNELTSIEIRCCRHCHGEDHAYQWRDEGEFQRAHGRWMRLPADKKVSQAEPAPDGGFGFRAKRPPHPDCPQCDGDGYPATVIRDTTRLSPGARLLFAGVKQTQHGIEIKMHDQADALMQLARHLGMFKEDTGAAAITDLAAAVQQINQRGSAAPISTPGKKGPPA